MEPLGLVLVLLLARLGVCCRGMLRWPYSPCRVRTLGERSRGGSSGEAWGLLGLGLGLLGRLGLLLLGLMWL